MAFKAIGRDLEKQGIKIGVNMVNAALELAVVKLK
jgi:hypothetical protein